MQAGGQTCCKCLRPEAEGVVISFPVGIFYLVFTLQLQRNVVIMYVVCNKRRENLIYTFLTALETHVDFQRTHEVIYIVKIVCSYTSRNIGGAR